MPLRHDLFRIRRKLGSYLFRGLYPVAPRRPFSPAIFEEELRREPVAPPTPTGSVPSPLLISFDDTSLLDGSRGTCDTGGNPDGETWRLFRAFADEHPQLRHTLYFVPNPRYRLVPDVSDMLPDGVFSVAHHGEGHPLVAALQEMERRGTVEVALHGYEHVRGWPLDYYAAYEFDFIDAARAARLVARGCEELGRFFDIRGFKPPAWSAGQLRGDCYLADVVAESGLFRYASLSSPSNGLNYARHACSHIHPGRRGSCVLIPQNLSILWDEDFLRDMVDLICERRGIINIQLHFCPASGLIRDGLCDDNLRKLARIAQHALVRGARPMLTREAACA